MKCEQAKQREQHLRNAELANNREEILGEEKARGANYIHVLPSFSIIESLVSGRREEEGAFIEFYLPLPLPSCTVVGQIASGIDLLTLYDAPPPPLPFPPVLRGTGFR